LPIFEDVFFGERAEDWEGALIKTQKMFTRVEEVAIVVDRVTCRKGSIG
jgi:hypothetical protein